MSLLIFLTTYELDCYYDDVVDIIQHTPKLGHRTEIGLYGYSTPQLLAWLDCHDCFRHTSTSIGPLLLAEWIDGDCFMTLSDRDWMEIGMDLTTTLLFSCIKKGWAGGWEESSDSFICKPRTVFREPCLPKSVCFGNLIVLGYKVSQCVLY